MRDYKDEMLQYMNAKQLCWQTKQEYTRVLNRYLGFCYHEGIQAEEMPASGLISFVAEVSASPSIAKQRRAVLIYLYGIILNQGYKLKGLPVPVQRVKVPESLSPEEIKRLFDAVPKTLEGRKQCLIMKMMYGCGLRVSEGVSVHIDQFREKISMPSGKKYFELKITGKGTKERLVPVPDDLMNEIQNHIQERGVTGYLFKGQLRECYSAKSVQEVFMRAKLACGITTPGNTHLLRKSRTTRFIDAQMSDRNVMLYFGWSNQKTINHYHKASTSSMKNTIDEIDKIEYKSVLLYNSTSHQLLNTVC